ncbi:hypothetical protein CRG98_033148 [Punica granatum]|uniref:Sm protein G n=1 Tax=Punica granatum TaxID=22663 RepID=A0A2I0IRZ0_PUNGR|nr:hypothetical protein CRG98_033148 [Punica granatum]
MQSICFRLKSVFFPLPKQLDHSLSALVDVVLDPTVIDVSWRSLWLGLISPPRFKFNANRMVVGTLCGFDQFMNLVAENTIEVIQGNSVVIVEALEPVNKS